MVRQSSAKAPPPVRFWASPPIVLLVAAFIVAAIAGPLVGLRALDAASNAQIRLANARADLDALLRTQLAEETALRGYVATRDPQFLDEDKPPNPAFDRAAASLESRLYSAEIPHGVETVEAMRRVHAAWEAGVAVPLLRDPRSRNAYAQQATGKLLTDELSRAASQLRAEVAAASARVEGSLRRRINATLAISAGFVTLFAIVALWYALGRASAITRLARERVLVDALQRTLRVGGAVPVGTRVGSAYASATSEALVGGDVLDGWRAHDGTGWFLIADTSGKGIAAARQAAFVQYSIRALCGGADDPADVVTRFNRLFVDTFEEPELFVVLFLAAFDAASLTLRYASAGHATAYVRRGSLIDALPPTGAVIGLEREAPYTTRSVPLARSDLVLLATDGLGEAREPGGALFGEDRITTILRDAPADPQAVCDLLAASAEAFSGGVQDDLAILAFRIVDRDAVPARPLPTIGARPA